MCRGYWLVSWRVYQGDECSGQGGLRYGPLFFVALGGAVGCPFQLFVENASSYTAAKIGNGILSRVKVRVFSICLNLIRFFFLSLPL